MSLNHKRRIFRSELLAAPSFGRLVPAPGVLLAAFGGLIVALAAVALVIHPSDAPARAPDMQRITASADELAVIDGGTLRFSKYVVRLEGIAVPARGSTCHTATAGTVDCGVAAANLLASLVKYGPVACTIHGVDSTGRPLAACQSAGVSLGEALVRRGWARARTADLHAAEDAARADGVGIWREVGGS